MPISLQTKISTTWRYAYFANSFAKGQQQQQLGAGTTGVGVILIYTFCAALAVPISLKSKENATLRVCTLCLKCCGIRQREQQPGAVTMAVPF